MEAVLATCVEGKCSAIECLPSPRIEPCTSQETSPVVVNSIGKFPSLLFESAHSPRYLNNQPLNCMLFTSARMSSSSVFSFHTLSSPGARQTTECEWFAKRKSWRRPQGVDHSPCARGMQKRLDPLRHTCYHGVWRASTVGTHPAALIRQSCCSYAAGEADAE